MWSRFSSLDGEGVKSIINTSLPHADAPKSFQFHLFPLSEMEFIISSLKAQFSSSVSMD